MNSDSVKVKKTSGSTMLPEVLLKQGLANKNHAVGNCLH